MPATRKTAAEPRLTDALRVETLDRKYIVILSAEGKLRALRYGSGWRDCCGDGLILTLAQDIECLNERLAQSRAAHAEALALLREIADGVPGNPETHHEDYWVALSAKVSAHLSAHGEQAEGKERT